MFILALVLLVIVGATVGILKFFESRDRERSWQPEELRDAKCVMIERTLYTQNYSMVGRVDRVFQLTNGLLTPVEFKTREHFNVYAEDVAELSLQAWMLRQLGKKTHDRAYVLIQHRKTKERKCIEVQLYNESKCEEIILRYFMLKAGDVEPIKNKGGKCRTCGHRAMCHKI